MLAARPDVARPAPSDIVALASRLAVPVSVDRALDELDAATLQVLDVVLLAPTDGRPADELVAALPDAKIDYAAGFGIDDATGDAALAEEALRVVGGADVVVAYLGLPATAESEGFDRTHLELPAAQTDLLARLAGAGAPVVVVLANGSAVRTAPWEQHAAAVLECWLGGQAVGGAIADVLTGAADPGGRLAETIPLRLEDTPSYLNFPGEEGRVRYGEGVFVGYRGFDAAGREVAYPFGHGVSYTTFAYDDLAVRVSGTDVTVEVTVTNTGERTGREVAQLYVGDRGS